MSGIYIHIPFCKQACHYCDFHFSTSLKKKGEMIAAICKEIVLRRHEINDIVKTIYFGGGTPSLLTSEEIKVILKTVYDTFEVVENPEITLEANPDDLISVGNQSSTIFENLKSTGVNRLSIGVQSFYERDLKLMNRAHNETEALDCIQEVKKHFDNFSIDLIYGIPEMTSERWIKNVQQAIDLGCPHISCYALTVEPKTALKNFIEKGIIPPVEDELAQKHHEILVTMMEESGYDNYEFSNFGKPGKYSQNNMAYWQGKSYLGVGPSAHSYDGEQRTWNVANNSKYLKRIVEGELPLEREVLSVQDRYNEYVMTRLRTMWGVSLEEIKTVFGEKFQEYILKVSEAHIREGLISLENNHLIITKKGKFLSDGIASDLFFLNLD